MRQRCIFLAVATYKADHLAAAQERRHSLQQLLLAVQHAYAHRSEHLVAAEGKKISIHFLHINRHMRCALRFVNHSNSANLMRSGNSLSNRVQASQNVGNLCHCYDFSFFGYSCIDSLIADAAVSSTFNVLYYSTGLLCNHAPGQHVAVMLHNRGNDFITGLKVSQTIAVSYQVQAFRSIAGENNFLLAFGIDELLHSNTGIFINIGCLHCQVIQATQRISIVFEIKITLCLNNAGRLLCGSRVVQISNIVSCQQREILFIIKGQ